MKYLQKITLSLLAIVVVALGSNAVAAAHDITVDGLDAGDYTVTGGTSVINVNDVDADMDGGAVTLTGTSDVPLHIINGIVQVGTGGSKTTAGATTVEIGAILEITAATANCIAGDVEVKAGGILQVDDNIPASGGPFATGADLTVHSGAVIKLGAGKTWSKDINVVA